MSWDFCETTTQTARKDYRCEASDWIWEQVNEGLFTFAEMRLIVKARREKWRIKKGQKYIKCQGKYMGEFTVFRARPELDELCRKYELYQE